MVVAGLLFLFCLFAIGFAYQFAQNEKTKHLHLCVTLSFSYSCCIRTHHRNFDDDLLKLMADWESIYTYCKLWRAHNSNLNFKVMNQMCVEQGTETEAYKWNALGNRKVIEMHLIFGCCWCRSISSAFYQLYSLTYGLTTMAASISHSLNHRDSTENRKCRSTPMNCIGESKQSWMHAHTDTKMAHWYL